MLFNGEMYAFAILGVLSGVLGAAFVHAVASLVTLIRQLREIVATPHAPPSQAGLRSRYECARARKYQ